MTAKAWTHAGVTHRPSLNDWLKEMTPQPWMAGLRKLPVKVVD